MDSMRAAKTAVAIPVKDAAETVVDQDVAVACWVVEF